VRREDKAGFTAPKPIWRIELKTVNRPYRNLPARPIMIYPNSPEQRQAFEKGAKAECRSLSGFIVYVVRQYIKQMRREVPPPAAAPETPEARMRRRFRETREWMRRNQSPLLTVAALEAQGFERVV
jgi:hypothetical protein